MLIKSDFRVSTLKVSISKADILKVTHPAADIVVKPISLQIKPLKVSAIVGELPRPVSISTILR